MFSLISGKSRFLRQFASSGSMKRTQNRGQRQHMDANDTPCQQVAELQREYERLSLEKHQYLQTLNNSEALKLQLRETRKDAKHLSKQKKKLQAMTDIGKSSEEVMQWVMVLILLKQYFLTLLSE